MSKKSMMQSKFITVGLFVASLLLFSTMAYADMAPKGDWRLNSNALDDGYDGNNGSIVGSMSFSTGIFGQAANFIGTNYIQIPSYSNFNNMASFTLAAWVYPTLNNSYNSIISKVNPNRDFDLQLSNGKINAHFAHGATYYSCTSDNTVPLNQWSFVAAVWTGTKWQIYYNGVLVKEADFTGKAPLWTGTKMGIGTMDFTYNFNGKLDEVKVFDTALNTTQLYDMYSSGLRTTTITLSGDDQYDLYINGSYLGSSSDWRTARKFNASLVPGKNVVAVRVQDYGVYAGLLADIQCEGVHIGTDFNWKVATTNYSYWNTTSFDDSNWEYANSFGRYGVYPWNKSVVGMPADSDAYWIWQGSTNYNPAYHTLYFRMELNVTDDPNTGRFIEIMDPRPSTAAFAGVDYQVKSNVQTMPAAISSRLVSNLKSTAVDEIEEADSGTLYIPADEFASNLKSTSASGAALPALPAVNDVYLDTGIQRALKIQSSTYNSATGSMKIDYVKADVPEVFEYYDIPNQTVELNETNYIPASSLKSTGDTGTYQKIGNQHIYSFTKNLINVNQNGFIAKVDISGKLTLTSPKLTGSYKRKSYDFKFTASEAAEVKITGNVQLKKEVKIPLYGFNIDAGLGKVTIGIFIVLSVDGKVTFEYGIIQSYAVETGVKGKCWWYIPTSFNPYFTTTKNFSVTKKVNGNITLTAGLQPEVALEICGKKILGLYVFAGIEGNATFSLYTYTLKIDALLKSALSVFTKNFTLFNWRLNLVNESGNL